MELNFGSNIVSNSNGILSIEGKNQIHIEVGDESQPFLTMNLYDDKGKSVGVLTRNELVANPGNRFATTVTSSSLKLTDTTSDELIISVTVAEGNIVQILQGKFYTHVGKLLEITPDYYSIERIKVKNNITDSFDKAFVVC
jgi:hypothetical protein